MASVAPHLSLKNCLFLIAGFCVIALAIIPLISSVPWWVSVGIGVTALLALLGQALMQSSEDQQMQTVLSRIAEDLGTKSVTVAVKGVSASITAGAVLVVTSPQIYPDIKGKGKGLFSKTEIILCNRGVEVAHKIHVEPIALRSGSIMFSRIETLAPGVSEDITATAENTSALSQHNITSLLMRDWDAKGEATTEFPIPMRIIYEDVIHRQFETAFDLIYLPVKDIVEQNPFDIRNLEIRPLVQPVVP